jgi:hypothetical protein
MSGKKITGGAEAHTRNLKHFQLRIVTNEIKHLPWLQSEFENAFTCASCGIIHIDEAGRWGKHEPLCWDCADTQPQASQDAQLASEPFIYKGLNALQSVATRLQLVPQLAKKERGTV